MPTVYLSLGSNLGDREAHLRDAIRRLESRELLVTAASSVYETEPVGQGGVPAPAYLNAVVRAETSLSPDALLQHTACVEDAAGRTREYRWAPRTIDIDILLYDDVALDTERLTVPHPRMFVRAFVLVPLAEIAPNLVFADGTTVRERLADPVVRAQSIHRSASLSRPRATPP